MQVIGFRCFTDGFSFVVLDGTQEAPQLIAYKKLRFPVDFLGSKKLAWLRKEIVGIFDQYQITSAGIKIAEVLRRTQPRSEAEGVVQESVYSKIGRECTTRIKSQLRRDISGFTEPARYLEQVLITRGLNTLNNEEYRDAALVAIAELDG